MIQEKIYKYFEGNPSLHVLFVFDSVGAILMEIESCEWPAEYRIVQFKGDWFTVKYNIDHAWKHDHVVLVFTGRLAPDGQDEMVAFPLYGEMKANMVYSEEDYVTFMQLKGIGEENAPFIARHLAELQLTKYDKILADYYKPGVFSVDICNRGLISGYLGLSKLASWDDIIIRIVCLCGNPSEATKRESFFRLLRQNQDASKALSDRLVGIAGYSFEPMSELKLKAFAESFKYNAITQNIPVINADDYKPYKITNAVVLQHLNSFREVASGNDGFVDAIEFLASGIKEDKIISWYGADAEYSYFTEALCWPIIKNFLSGKVMTAPVDTNERLRALSLRMPATSPVQQVVNYLSNACFMLEKLQGLGTFKLKTPMDYVNKYTAEFYLIDTYYRLSCGSFKKINTLVPVFEDVHKLKTRVDEEYSKACNLFNQEWLSCVKEKDVSLAKMEGIMHQQDFYTTKLKGVDAKRVVIISDAMRYEVAVELMNGLGDAKHDATLTAALSILPTETKYSKMTLLPHSLLQYNECDLLVDGQRLASITDRTAHVKKFEDKALCIDFEDLQKMSQNQKRELFKAPLVYIFHDVIDSMSHDNPTMLTTACAEAVADLDKLIPSLHATYNVANVYVTSDHGFLFNDIPFAEKDKHKITDGYDERKTRYYITNDFEDNFGIAKFPMSKVATMTNANKIVAVPLGTNRLYAEGGEYQYAHGGASLQEMIIPVLYSHIRRTGAKPKVGLTLLGSALTITSSRLKFNIIQSDAVSEDFQEREVACAIYEGDQALTAERIIKLDSTDVNPQNRFYSVELILNKPSAGGLLELRIFDTADRLNPLAKATVTNKTLIEQDF